jgi:hypothetical protein
MSKVKDEMVRIQELEFERYVSFMEWVCDQEVSETGTKEEEENSQEPSTAGTSIVPTNTLRVANNVNYNPNRSIK